MARPTLPEENADRLDWPARGFSERTRRVILAAAEAMLADLDDEGRVVPGPADLCARAVDEFDHGTGRASADVKRGLAVLSFLLEWLPLFIVRVPSRMSKLPLEARIAYLERLEGSRSGLLSMLFVAIKVPLCIPAFEEETALASTGFDRPSTISRRGPRRSREREGMTA